MPHTWRQPANAFTNHSKLQDETLPQPRNTSLIAGMRSEKSHVGTSILIQHCCKDPFSIVIMLHTGCCTNNVKCHKLDDSQHMPAQTTKNCKMKHTATPFPQVHIALAQAHISHRKHAVREISCGYQYPHTALLQGSVFDSHHAAHRLLCNNVKCHKLDDSQHMPSQTTKKCKMKHTATPFPQVHIAPARAHIPHRKHAVREISCGYQYPHTALLQGSVFDSHHAAHGLLYKQCQMPQT